MNFSSAVGPIAAFVLILALIPAALWLLKRTPMGGAGANGLMRVVGALPLSPSQRLVTVEVGSGDERRWLVLGVSPGSIATLHEMAPQAEPPATGAPALPGFAQLLQRQQRATRPASDGASDAR